MGCFDSTCALTRLPIHHEDEIVYVEYRCIWSNKTRDLKTSTYDLLHYSSAAFQIPEHELKYIRESETEFCKRHPEFADELERIISERVASTLEYARGKIVIVHGAYNDYGGIGESWNNEAIFPPDDIRQENVYFFVHKFAWQAYSGENDYETLYNLNRAAMDARIELFSCNRPLGQQYSGSEYVEAYTKIRDITGAIIDTLYCSQQEEGEDE